MKKNKIYKLFDTKGVLLIILIGFAFRMVFFVSLKPWDDKVINKTILVYDAGGYHSMALGLLSEKSFNSVGSVRTPIYPMFLATCYLISGKTIWFALLVQIVVNLLTIFTAYKIALEFFSKRIALLTMFLLAIDYHQAELAVCLMTDTLFSFIFIVSIYFLCIGLKRNHIIKYMAISGCFLGLATLTRPISYLFPVAAVFFIICYILFTKKNDTARSKVKLSTIYSLYYVLAFLLIIAPWLYRNYSLYKEAKLTSLAGVNLLLYNVAITEADRSGQSFKETKAYFMQKAYEAGCDTAEYYSFANSPILSQIAIEYIKNNFLLYCKSHLKGMVNLFYNFERFSEMKTLSGFAKYKNIGFLIYFGIIYFFSIWGVVSAIEKKYIIALLFFLIIIYFDFITGVVGDPRYEVPIMPFIYILCAVGFYRFYDIIKYKFSHVKLKKEL
jgi:4-amino-4-deoxy-L-arabinose transferase-like glycosyltransferase